MTTETFFTMKRKILLAASAVTLLLILAVRNMPIPSGFTDQRTLAAGETAPDKDITRFHAAFDIKKTTGQGTFFETASEGIKGYNNGQEIYFEVPFSYFGFGGKAATKKLPLPPGKTTHVDLFYQAPDKFMFAADGAPVSIIKLQYLCPSFASVKMPDGASITATQAGVQIETGRKKRLSAAAVLYFKGLLFVLFFAELALLAGTFSKKIFYPAMLALFFLAFGAVSTRGTFNFGGEAGYYHMLAESFSAGKLHLLRLPPPEHLQMADPYRFSAAKKFHVWDFSLYKGKYYLYFAPAPALVRILFGLNLKQRFATTLYVWLLAVMLFLTLHYFRDKYFPDLSPRLFWTAALLTVFNPLSLYLVMSATVYAEAVYAAAAFFAGGCYFYMRAAKENKTKFWALSGICFAFAFSSRVSLGPAFIAFFIAAAITRLRGEKKNIRQFAAFAAAPVLAASALLIYNKLRFGSFMEFGVTYQLNSTRQYIESGQFTSVKNILHNLYRYLLEPPVIKVRFPFIDTAKWPDEYYHMLFCFLMWVPFAGFALYIKAWKNLAPELKKFCLLLVGAAGITLLFDSLNIVATTRYLADWVYPVSLAAAPCFWLLAKDRPKTAKALAIAVIVLTVVMILIGQIYNYAEWDPDFFDNYLYIFG